MCASPGNVIPEPWSFSKEASKVTGAGGVDTKGTWKAGDLNQPDALNRSFTTLDTSPRVLSEGNDAQRAE